jgi:hypothetical protein
MSEDVIKKTGQYAASLSLIEIGLGSLLHGAKIPLSGQILSINQMALLGRASFKEKSKRIALDISLVSTCLKSLSPAGKKLTPMLAISMQGMLYSIGLIIFGVNYLGLFFSILLSASWAFIQPLIILFILFGTTLQDVTNFFIKEFRFLPIGFEKYLIVTIFGFLIFKIILTFFISLKVINLTDEKFKNLELKINFKSTKQKKEESNNQFINAIRDLFKPLFIFTYILTILFLLNNQNSYSIKIWMFLRPIAFGFIVFYLFRVYPLEKIMIFFDKLGLTKLSKTLKVSLNLIKEKKGL